jgi:hypothetical protein
MNFFRENEYEYIHILCSALDVPEERGLALELISLLPAPRRICFLGQLVSLGSYGHGFTEECWELISGLPRDFVSEHMEGEIENVLSIHESYEEYRSLITLCQRLGYSGLAHNLTLCALESSDRDIHEVGVDFLENEQDAGAGGE